MKAPTNLSLRDAAIYTLAQFAHMKMIQHDLLDHGLEAAIRNWDAHPEAFSSSFIELQPLIDAVANDLPVSSKHDPQPPERTR